MTLVRSDNIHQSLIMCKCLFPTQHEMRHSKNIKATQNKNYTKTMVGSIKHRGV